MSMAEQGSELGDIDVTGVVNTPTGRTTLVEYTVTPPNGVVQFCDARLSPGSGGASCGEGAPPNPELEDGELLIPGLGNDGTWVDLEIRAGDAVASIRAVANDGTVYRSNVVDNVAILVYPQQRGSLTITPLNADGEPTGDPVRSDLP